MSTTSCNSCLLILPPSSAGSTSTAPTDLPSASYTVRFRGLDSLATLMTLHKAAKPRDSGPWAWQVLFNIGIDVQQKTQARCERHGLGCRLAMLSISRQDADLDVHARRQAQAFVQRLDRLARRLQDVDEPLVSSDFELLAALAVDVRAAQHRVALDARRQRDRAMDDGAGALRRVYDLVRGAVEHFVIERLHADADAFAHACGQG